MCSSWGEETLGVLRGLRRDVATKEERDGSEVPHKINQIHRSNDWAMYNQVTLKIKAPHHKAWLVERRNALIRKPFKEPIPKC